VVGRQAPRVAAVVGGQEGVRPVVEQEPRHLHVVAVGGRVEWREAALLAPVGIRAGLEQEPHRLMVVRGRGGVDGPHAERVLRVVVRVGAVREEDADGRGAAEERRQPQGGEALRRPLRDPRGIGGQQRLESVDAAGGGSLEHAELRAGREDLRGHFALLMEERDEHHRKAVGVARRSEFRLLAQQLADGFRVAARDRRDERSDARILGHQRTISQTRSVTSFVNAASWRKACGLPREVSEKLTVPASMRTL
jgi:hypothetical protein